MIEIYCEKLYKYSRIEEPVSVTIPFKKGAYTKTEDMAVLQNGSPVLIQPKVTARYDDGSIRYLFLRFLADLPANKAAVLQFDVKAKAGTNSNINKTAGKGMTATVEKVADGFRVDTGCLKYEVANHSGSIFKELDDGRKIYKAADFEGPYLKDGNGDTYDMQIDTWRVVEAGPVCVILSAEGSSLCSRADDTADTNTVNADSGTGGAKNIRFELRLTAYAGKPWTEVSYRIINTTDEPLAVKSLVFHYKAGKEAVSDTLVPMNFDAETDSTGCGDTLTDNSANEGPLFHTRGILELEAIEKKTPLETVRTLVGSSNYKTDFFIGKDGEPVNKVIDAKYLLKEANEHFAEVLYGTFMADRTDEKDGLCITVYQAQQNYPKAVRADKNGISVMLVPEGVGNVVMQPGMAREQQFLMHFHAPEEPVWELDNRSLIYQMPDRPCIAPRIFKEAGVMLDVFPEKLNNDVEIALMGKADAHARCYGMLNWGDTWDSGYTMQGRGNGRVVWSNNEYDFPHSCALQYARTGVRRYLDYLLVTAKHWMDVDICHYSKNPLRIGGQWEHTAGHCANGVMVCSHEWVEGLLDYYHFSGDERGLASAIGIGENVLRLLDTPMYAHAGEANARETGWALRTLTALYIETHDKKWVEKCDWIIHSFEVWEDEYGSWLAPYTDNTAIRVGFMISVAVGSVMRYYREFPQEDIKEMLIRAVDDLIENCLMDNGLFYYKELPSLARLGNNTLLLESLAIAYELTGDKKYLAPGLETFKRAIYEKPSTTNGQKREEEDAVIGAGSSTKGFAQSFIPLITYYKALSENDMRW